jgi:hypothetical protein
LGGAGVVRPAGVEAAMMGRHWFSLAGIAVLAAIVLSGCSSDDNSASALTPFDSGSVSVPEAAPPPAEFVQVQVQGQGTVESSDAHVVDGGTVGLVVCSVGSPASQCSAQRDTTLYALPAVGWVASTWTTTGLAAGISLDGATTSYAVTAGTPSPLIVIFAPQGTVGPPVGDAGTPASDGDTQD